MEAAGSATGERDPVAEAVGASNQVSEDTRRLYDSPALKAWQEALGNTVKIDDSILKAAGALANSVKYEHPSASANPPVEALAPPLPPADLEDTPDGVLGVATAKMLMRSRTWGDLCAELGRLCDARFGRLNVCPECNIMRHALCQNLKRKTCV